jgi:hypothetical protein
MSFRENNEGAASILQGKFEIKRKKRINAVK